MPGSLRTHEAPGNRRAEVASWYSSILLAVILASGPALMMMIVAPQKTAPRNNIASPIRIFREGNPRDSLNAMRMPPNATIRPTYCVGLRFSCGTKICVPIATINGVV